MDSVKGKKENQRLENLHAKQLLHQLSLHLLLMILTLLFLFPLIPRWHLTMVPRSVSVHGSSRLQWHTLGKMDTNTPCFSCGALKWLDERVTESTKCSLNCICNLLSQGKVLPCLQEPPAVLKSYLICSFTRISTKHLCL